jgi:signal transduction histidine kinase
MSKMIIQNSMHGQLHAENIPGGACFRVTLPVHAAEDATAETDRTSAVPPAPTF